MGEGWSDAFADWTEQTSATVKDFTLGSWAFPFLYWWLDAKNWIVMSWIILLVSAHTPTALPSESIVNSKWIWVCWLYFRTTNPYTYATSKTKSEVHGELLWTLQKGHFIYPEPHIKILVKSGPTSFTMSMLLSSALSTSPITIQFDSHLFNVMDYSGFDADAKTNPRWVAPFTFLDIFDTHIWFLSSTAGNAVFMHLFIDALALQPCNPTCTSCLLPPNGL